MNEITTLESLLFTILKKWDIIPALNEAAQVNIKRYMKMLYGDSIENIVDTQELLDALIPLSKVSYLTSTLLIEEQKLPLFYKQLYEGVDILESAEGVSIFDSNQDSKEIISSDQGTTIIGASISLSDFKQIVTKLRMQ